MNWSRQYRAVVLVVLLLLVAAVGVRCTTTARPAGNLNDPVAVHIVEYGRTAGLVLPDETGRTLWVYGDWGWYAEDRTGVLEAMAALLWPTDAGLGYQPLGPQPDAEAVRRAVGAETIHALLAEREKVADLAAELRAMVEAHPDERQRRPGSGLTFVPHDRRYSAMHHSHNAVADWLNRIGVETSGTALITSWRVVEPE